MTFLVFMKISYSNINLNSLVFNNKAKLFKQSYLIRYKNDDLWASTREIKKITSLVSKDKSLFIFLFLILYPFLILELKENVHKIKM